MPLVDDPKTTGRAFAEAATELVELAEIIQADDSTLIDRGLFLLQHENQVDAIEDCRSLLKLYADTDRASAEVKQIAEEHLDRIDSKIAELTEMRATLSHLVDACAGDHRPDCPILADLATEPNAGSISKASG